MLMLLDLVVQTWSREIGFIMICIALKFDRHLIIVYKIIQQYT